MISVTYTKNEDIERGSFLRGWTELPTRARHLHPRLGLYHQVFGKECPVMPPIVSPTRWHNNKDGYTKQMMTSDMWTAFFLKYND